MSDTDDTAGKVRRWGSRQDAMDEGRVGPTTLNGWIQDRKVFAKKSGTKVIIDLNSVHAHIESLPDASKKTA